MSEKHSNFMINTGVATAHDLETLGETIRKRVFQNAGLTLQWEIKRVGEFLGDPVKDGVASDSARAQEFE